MKHSYLALVIAAVLSGAVLVGCDSNEDAAGDAAQQQMPPSVVNVQTVTFETVPQVQTFSGRTSAYQTADVRPQVNGVIDEILFREGSTVKKGQPLYRINTDNYASSVTSGRAAVQQAQANYQTAVANSVNAQADLVSQQATLSQAQNDLQRLSGLVEIDAISKQQYEQAVTTVRTAQAAVQSANASIGQAKAGIESAKAGLQSSSLDLDRTIVRAPISGRSDRSSFTAGALVSASQADPLVTVSRLDPIYVDISQSSSELLKLRQQISAGKAQAGLNTVELVLEDGTVYPVSGELALSEAKVDESTGAVTLRAIFPNSNSILLPGMYVSARLTQSVINNAVLVPQSAVTRSVKGETQVYIVDENNKIKVRPVTVNGTYNGNWVVTDGLKEGEKLVVIGGSKVKPDQEVVAKPVENATPASTGNSAPASTSAKTPQQAATETKKPAENNTAKKPAEDAAN